MTMFKALKRRIFHLPYDAMTYNRLGFDDCSPLIKARADEYFTTFLDGYNFAVEADNLEALSHRLNKDIGAEFRGFAYEGAGMHLALKDFISPLKSNSLGRFIAGPASRHDFITVIGAGFVFSRLPWVRRNIKHFLKRIGSDLCWLALDGYGFHEGFFYPKRYIEECRLPPDLPGYALNYFDNGIGRSIWFAKGASPEGINAAMSLFPQSRRANLWAGIGLASAYAGGLYGDMKQYIDTLRKITEYGAEYHEHIRLGVVLAAAARFKADTESLWTTCACEFVLGMSFSEAAGLLQKAFEEAMLSSGGSSPDASIRDMYGMTRSRIMTYLECRPAMANSR